MFQPVGSPSGERASGMPPRLRVAQKALPRRWGVGEPQLFRGPSTSVKWCCQHTTRSSARAAPSQGNRTNGPAITGNVYPQVCQVGIYVRWCWVVGVVSVGQEGVWGVVVGSRRQRSRAQGSVVNAASHGRPVAGSASSRQPRIVSSRCPEVRLFSYGP